MIPHHIRRCLPWCLRRRRARVIRNIRKWSR